MRFYVDVYFILNFSMNLFLLGITALLRRQSIQWQRLILGAALGGVIATFLGYEYLRGETILCLLGGIAEMLVMIRIAYGKKSRKEAVRNITVFVEITLISGGGIYVLSQYMYKHNKGNGFACISLPVLFGGVVLCGLASWLVLHQFGIEEQMQKHQLDVKVTHRGVQIVLRGIKDKSQREDSRYSQDVARTDIALRAKRRVEMRKI